MLMCLCSPLNFQSKKIVDNNFDKLPLHGLGKGYSSNWWKALAGLLIAHGNKERELIFICIPTVLILRILKHILYIQNIIHSSLLVPLWM